MFFLYHMFNWNIKNILNIFPCQSTTCNLMEKFEITVQMVKNLAIFLNSMVIKRLIEKVIYSNFFLFSCDLPLNIICFKIFADLIEFITFGTYQHDRSFFYFWMLWFCRFFNWFLCRFDWWIFFFIIFRQFIYLIFFLCFLMHIIFRIRLCYFT